MTEPSKGKNVILGVVVVSLLAILFYFVEVKEEATSCNWLIIQKLDGTSEDFEFSDRARYWREGNYLVVETIATKYRFEGGKVIRCQKVRAR